MIAKRSSGMPRLTLICHEVNHPFPHSNDASWTASQDPSMWDNSLQSVRERNNDCTRNLEEELHPFREQPTPVYKSHAH